MLEEKRGIIIQPKISPQDCLRYELFECLLPRLVYTGTKKEQDRVLNALRYDGPNFIHTLFAEMCQEDQIACPYHITDFKVKCVERGGISMVQVELPRHNPDISDILRIYLLFQECDNDVIGKKYFLIKRFYDGQTFIVHINENNEGILGEELTQHAADMEYEYWRLANEYARAILPGMREEKRRRKRKSKKAASEKQEVEKEKE